MNNMATKPSNNAEVPAASMDDITDTQEHNLPAVVDTGMKLGAVDGDVSASDFRLPRLQIAYGVGGLAENFHPGDLVLAGENLLVEKGKPLRVIVLQATTYWKEYTSGKKFIPGGPLPQCFKTAAEAHDAGFTTEWTTDPTTGVKSGPGCSKAMQLKLLIEQPEGILCTLFGIKLGKKIYAPAIWDVDKSAYRRIQPVVQTASSFSLRERGLLSGVFEIMTKFEKIGDNMTPVPMMKLADNNSDEVVKEIVALFAEQEEPPF
jgi:hypothetical protein